MAPTPSGETNFKQRIAIMCSTCQEEERAGDAGE